MHLKAVREPESPVRVVSNWRFNLVSFADQLIAAPVLPVRGLDTQMAPVAHPRLTDLIRRICRRTGHANVSKTVWTRGPPLAWPPQPIANTRTRPPQTPAAQPRSVGNIFTANGIISTRHTLGPGIA